MLAPPCWAYLFSLFFNQVLLCEPLLLRKCKFRDLVCFGFCLCFFCIWSPYRSKPCSTCVLQVCYLVLVSRWPEN